MDQRRMKLHNEELHNLYFSPNNIRMIKSRKTKWAANVTCMTAEKKNVQRNLVGNPEGKISLGRSVCRWAVNIKIDLKETGGRGMDWIDLAQDRGYWRASVNTIVNLLVP
jgi:hypothetical protein